MRIQLNFKSGVPVYVQLVEQVKAAAASGALKPGEPLPSIRPLAEELRINRNTVAKAYAELEGQGIVESVAGKGCFLANNHSPLKKEVRKKMLSEYIDAAVVQAHHLQVSENEFLSMVQERLSLFAQQNKTNATKNE
jgi:DNA-binding transcriptional regulator YhcF (GntR family)